MTTRITPIEGVEVYLKSPEELALMREAGRIVALAHQAMKAAIRPGISTGELDKIAETVIRDHGAKPAFLGQIKPNTPPFPATITASINEELVHEAKKHMAPLELVESCAKHGKLPVPNFSAGGIATPADVALVMHLGAEAVFVGSGIFKSSDPERRAKAIVKAATHYRDAAKVLEASEDLGDAMPGLDISKLPESELMQTRGW